MTRKTPENTGIPDVRPLDHLMTLSMGGLALFYVPSETPPTHREPAEYTGLLQRLAQRYLPQPDFSPATA